LVNVVLDGVTVDFIDTNAQIIGGYTYVPIARIIEILTGTPPSWDANAKSASFYYNGNAYKIYQTQPGIYVNDVLRPFAEPNLIRDARTLIPLRMLSEALGFGIGWDNATSIVTLTSPGTPPVTPTPPTHSTPPPGNVPFINSANYSRLSLPAGTPVTVTVVTNSAVNNVWIDMGNRSYVDATYSYTSVTGEKTWAATINPQVTTNVTVLANTSRNTVGAAVKAQLITVTGSNIRIESVDVDRVSIASGGRVTFTIRTTTAAEYVWVEYDNSSTNATYRSQSQGYKIWEVTITPRISQRVNIYANASRSTTGAANKTQQITVAEDKVQIHRVNASRTAINEGEYTTLTIETSRNVEYISVEYDNSITNAQYERTSADRDYWTVNISPKETQRVRITAKSRNNQYGTANETIHITVNQTVRRPQITGGPNIEGSSVVTPGEEVVISVSTNIEAIYVWAQTPDGGTFNAVDVTRSGISGGREWMIYTKPTQSGNITVYANSSRSTTGAASGRVSVEVHYLGVHD
jgi:hypothetical protein